MSDGKVKWFNERKGFGFISSESGGPDVFVHASELGGETRTLQEGDLVEYELVQGEKGPKAANVIKQSVS